MADFPVASALGNIIGAYLYLALARALLQYADADSYNPVSRFIDRITIVPIQLFRMFVPRIKGSDLLSPALLVLLCATVQQLVVHGVYQPVVLIVLGLARTIDVAANFLTIVILAHVVLSWVAPRRIFAMSNLVNSIGNWALVPFRRFIPAIGSFDFSPIVALFAISAISSTLNGVLIRMVM